MFGFRLKLSLLVFSLLPLLTGLGVWQLSRYKDKQALEQMYESRHQLPAVSLSELNTVPDPLYMPLKAEGRFDGERYFLLDNQTFQGRVGYQLIMPFLTTDGRNLLVNRGWIPMVNREIMPEIKTDKGILNLTGITWRSFGKPFLLSEDIWIEGWPKRIQGVNYQRMSQTLNQDIAPVMLILDKGQPGAEQVRPVTLNMKSRKHLAYAFQWFAMALVLLGLYGYQMRRSYRPKQQDIGSV